MSKPTIRDLRERKGLGRSESAALARISHPTLWRMESGVPVSAVSANRACNALGVEITDVDVEVLPSLSPRHEQFKLKRSDSHA